MLNLYILILMDTFDVIFKINLNFKENYLNKDNVIS